MSKHSDHVAALEAAAMQAKLDRYAREAAEAEASPFEPHEADATWFEVQKREPNYQGRWVLVNENDTFEDYKSCEARRKVYQAADEFGLYRSKKVRGQA